MRRVAKRGLMGLAGVAAAGSLVFAVATPAQANTVDIHIRTMEDQTGPGAVNVCIQIKPSAPSCLHLL